MVGASTCDDMVVIAHGGAAMVECVCEVGKKEETLSVLFRNPLQSAVCTAIV
jgi:hypothetical protein